MYFNRFRSVKRSNRVTWWKGMTALFPDYSNKTTWLLRWKIPLENPWKRHFQDSKFQNALAASPVKNLCLWCKFQIHLLFIVSLLLKNFLTALHYINILYMPI